MTTDEAQHEIARVLRQLQRDTGSMIVQVAVQWNVVESGFGRKSSTRLVKLEFTSGFVATEASG